MAGKGHDPAAGQQIDAVAHSRQRRTLTRSQRQAAGTAVVAYTGVYADAHADLLGQQIASGAAQHLRG